MATYVASAPGRCGIVGNPSDIYGGNVLSCSIPARATCRLTLGEENQLPEDTRLWDAAVARFPIEGPVKVEWSTDVPRSSGLSGSTALLAATLAAILAARGEAKDFEAPNARIEFAELVRDVERHEAGIMCGYQDAYMIVHGGLRYMTFRGKHPINPGPPAVLESVEAPLPFLLVTTGVERLSGSVHGPIAQRWLEGDPEVVAAIDTIQRLGCEGAEALKKGDFGTLGEAMKENHRLTASLGGSGDAIDTLIAKGLAHGAQAGKLAGAGLGGTVIFLTEDADALEAGLRTNGYQRFLRPEKTEGVRYE